MIRLRNAKQEEPQSASVAEVLAELREITEAVPHGDQFLELIEGDLRNPSGLSLVGIRSWWIAVLERYAADPSEDMAQRIQRGDVIL